jgi:hypothetical protein
MSHHPGSCLLLHDRAPGSPVAPVDALARALGLPSWPRRCVPGVGDRTGHMTVCRSKMIECLAGIVASGFERGTGWLGYMLAELDRE